MNEISKEIKYFTAEEIAIHTGISESSVHKLISNYFDYIKEHIIYVKGNGPTRKRTKKAISETGVAILLTIKNNANKKTLKEASNEYVSNVKKMKKAVVNTAMTKVEKQNAFPILIETVSSLQKTVEMQNNMIYALSQKLDKYLGNSKELKMVQGGRDTLNERVRYFACQLRSKDKAHLINEKDPNKLFSKIWVNLKIAVKNDPKADLANFSGADYDSAMKILADWAGYYSIDWTRQAFDDFAKND